MNKKIINLLFSDMCCSDCHTDFTDDSVKVIRQENNLFVLQVVCHNCGKAFGIALLGDCDEKAISKPTKSDLALQIQDGPDKIGYDDVIDAHKFIQALEDDWQKYIPEDMRNGL